MSRGQRHPAVAGDEADVEEGAEKPVSASIPTLDRGVVAPYRDQRTGGQVRNPTITTVPPMTASAPVPIPITAISRSTSAG